MRMESELETKTATQNENKERVRRKIDSETNFSSESVEGQGPASDHCVCVRVCVFDSYYAFTCSGVQCVWPYV